MTRISALIATFVIVGSAWAQTSDSVDLTDSSAADNVATGRVAARAPGTWVRAAIARHNDWIGARVTGPRFGTGPSEELDGAGESSADQSTTGSTGSLGDLSGLLGSLGSLGSLGDLTGLATSLTGGTSSTTSSTDGMDPRLAALLALRDAAAGSNKSINKSVSDQAEEAESTTTGASASDKGLTQQTQRYSFGGATSRLPKAEERFQDTTEDRKFLPRLVESWTTTFLTALSVGFQSTDFIDILKDAIRPLIIPETADGKQGDNTDGTDGIDGLSPSDGSDGTDGETVI